MSFSAKIHAHSITPDGVPLCTMEITVPRIILAEFNTHRVFSRNSASSRAIPVKKMIERLRVDPYIPSSWGKNQKGMQASEDVSEDAQVYAESVWKSSLLTAIRCAEELTKIGIHKQLTNRLLEPFMWHTIIVTATEWDNFFHLRNNPQAHPDIQTIAKMMQELYERSVPRPIDYGGWHLPLIDAATDEDVCRTMRAGRSLAECRQALVKISVARCARVSYLTHDGKRDHQADIDLHDKLLTSGHLSPFEHVARPATLDDDDLLKCHASGELFALGPEPASMWFGNFRGWVSYRKLIPHESDILGPRGPKTENTVTEVGGDAAVHSEAPKRS